MAEFYRVMQKSTDYSCAILFTPNNEKFFIQFIELLFKQMQEGVCQVSAKVVMVILKQMFVQFNGLNDDKASAIAKRVITPEQ